MSETRLSESLIAEIAHSLKAAREEKREDLAELAYRIALSPSQLRALESANTSPFYSHAYFLQAAQRYADAFGIKLPQEGERALSEQTIHIPAATNPVVTAPVAVREPQPASESIPRAPSRIDELQPARFALNAETDIAPSTVVSDNRMRWAWVGVACLFAILLGVTKIISDENAAQQESTSLANQSVTLLNNAPTADSATTAQPNAVPNINTPPAPAISAQASASTEALTAASTPSATARPQQQGVPLSLPPVVSASIPATKSNQSNTPTTNQKATAGTTNGSKSYLISDASTWVQVVRSSGEKINVRIQPGERVEFDAEQTAAIVFGRPAEATLVVRGGRVNLDPFIVGEEKRRALVLMSQIKTP